MCVGVCARASVHVYCFTFPIFVADKNKRRLDRTMKTEHENIKENKLKKKKTQNDLNLSTLIPSTLSYTPPQVPHSLGPAVGGGCLLPRFGSRGARSAGHRARGADVEAPRWHVFRSQHLLAAQRHHPRHVQPPQRQHRLRSHALHRLGISQVRGRREDGWGFLFAVCSALHGLHCMHAIFY